MPPRSAKTLIQLNVYDLVDSNELTGYVGLGFYHTGVEIAGEEFSYASGAGIFSSQPREAPGAKYRETIDMGYFDGTYMDARRVADSLRSEFEGDSYNLFTKNCNSFSDAFCQLLVNKSIPAYINRAAYLGSFLSCLLPAELGSTAPVGATNGASGGALSGPSQAAIYPAFGGTGMTLGSDSSSTQATPSTSETTLEDRRDRVRAAALRRFENANQQSTS